MSFLTPLFLLFGLLSIPIILLYMLRLRRREVVVSSTFLWQTLMRDREANAPWQRLRKNWLLILQLLILALLVLALARPFFPVPTVVNGNVVVLLDGSASMAATDVAPNRFGVAQAHVNEMIDALSGGDQMTLIQVGQTPEILAAATSDKGLLRLGLDSAESNPTPANWQAAYALATGAAQGYRDAKIVIVSDGGMPTDLPALASETIYVPVGEQSENLALTALATRHTDDGVQLFASVANYGAEEQTALLNISLGGVLHDSKQINVPANNHTNLTWVLPDNTVVIEADLSEISADFLPTDNQAWAIHEGGVSNRALLITEGNLFLEQLYSALPGIELFKATPDEEIAEEYDLYIFDRVVPAEMPIGDTLLIAPNESNRFVEVSGIFSNTVVTRRADTPLLQFVDWAGVDIRQAQKVKATWAQPLITAAGGDLILAGEKEGQRVVIFAFNLLDSDLPLQIAFPILMANLTSWLNPGQAFDAPAGVRIGQPVTIAPGASTTDILVALPDGATVQQEAEAGAFIFADTKQLGVYEVALRDSNGTRDAGNFAVNLFSAEESQITPASDIQIGFATVAESADENVGQREFWPWLAALAFIILLIEWWVYHRGLIWPSWQKST